MKRRSYFIALVLSLFSFNGLFADNAALSAMRKDFPGLMALYGDRIDSQHAHYIFVVDVSSSMRAYESTVKSNFLQFLDAVPDGDQVSLIKMSDENHTGFVGLLKCATIDPQVRTSIRQVVNGFNFNKTGSIEDGSDGFTMAKCVLEAINVVGSNDLTFVYMLTDFEYWTHKNKYDKSKENWSSLHLLLPDAKLSGMCKYGIELNSGAKLRQDAIFKTELDDVFGKVEYQSVGSAALLSNWFSHIASSVMSVKLNTLLKSDWNRMVDSVQPQLILSGEDVKVGVEAAGSPLVEGVTASLDIQNSYFRPVETDCPMPGYAIVGRLELPQSQKSFLPSFVKIGGNADSKLHLAFQTPYADEINRLQGVCNEVAGVGDTVNLHHTVICSLPSAYVWNSMLPLWLWVVILLVCLIVAASFVYQYLFIKLHREWSVSVKAVAPTGESTRFNNEGMLAPFTFGSADSDMLVKGAPWIIKIYTKRYNPLFFFKKSGYYMTLVQGTFAEVETDYDDEPQMISTGTPVLLCPAGKSTVVNIRIREKKTTDYKISLS